MNPASEAERSHLEELMAGQVLGDLSGDEAKEMQRLRARHPSVQMASFEEALNALSLASTHFGVERLPTDLRRKIEVDFSNHVAPSDEQDQAASAKQRKRSAAGGSVLDRIGWIAAAACFVVAVYGYWEHKHAHRQLEPFGQLVQRADIISPDWTLQPNADEHFANVTGKVYWSDTAQGGYMEFDGLPANDSAKEQYQLWIVDEARGSTPVDGGVFDVPGNGSVTIPIDAKLHISKAKAFAVTVENMGGSVVANGPKLLVASN